ncbi:hypothetical protein GS982_01220 [Rhodococcus hoagii]|uniref:C2H2-type domain-containing protein n=1 Tax=Rhodococcus hoagii TaxID=43767 RepID=A0A9Q4ZIG3_RHOHA|nr:hypothetical protein [Prescottella equi]NKT77228.1 hypothetical protein [Prescottella equi]NKZ81012.1 hypothetical protein [Prescottella equi]
MAKGRSQTEFTQDPNLAGFDDFGRKIAKRAFKQGWIGKRSNKSHLTLFAPDGQTTISVCRDNSAPRIQKNTLAPLEKWEKANKFLAPQAGEDGQYHCPVEGCDYANASRMGLVGHYTGNHSKPRVCKICKEEFGTPQGYTSHLAKHKEIARPAPEEPKTETPPAETEILDAEIVEHPTTSKRGLAKIETKKEYQLMSTAELIEMIQNGNAAAVELARRAESHETKLALIAEAASM